MSTKTIRHPIAKGVAKVPVVMQMERWNVARLRLL